MSKFLHYTVGLEANRGKKLGVMVKVGFYENEDGTITLIPESGRTLARLPGQRTITADAFALRPTSRNSVTEARWALGVCGYTLMKDSADELQN